MNSSSKLGERVGLTLKKTSIPYSIFYILTYNVVLVQTFAFIRGEYAYLLNANLLSFDSKKEELLMVVILAPFLETIAYQHFLIIIALFLAEKLVKKKSIILAIIIPAIFFASSHIPDYYYFLYTFFGALSFNVFYLIMKFRMQNAILFTLLVHVLLNLIVLGLKYI